MRTLIALIFLIFLSFLSPATPHIDYGFPVMPAATDATPRWPLVCDVGLANTFQFVWLAEPGSVVDRAAVEARLRKVAEEVNWLFWRASEGATEARVPAWKVTGDCRLDVRWGDAVAGGTLPPRHGETKTILVEPALDYCGYAFLADDDRPGAENWHNQSSFLAVARHCLGAVVVVHEMLHSMGAVQLGAPQGDGDWHGTEYDVMGRAGVTATAVCRMRGEIDCGRDDYFSLTPTGYLAERWNVANSVFLVRVQKVTVWLPVAMVGGE
jgi:hypothetical protein